MLDDGQIEGVTEDQLEELQDFEDISVDALTKLMSGKNLDEKTKKTLKEYQSHLITVINGIVERDIDKKTKHDLEKFKTTHTYFIVMIFKMQSGEKFDNDSLIWLEKTEEDLVNDIKQLSNQPNIILGNTVGILTKEQLESYKENHKQDKFIEVGGKSVNIMDTDQLEKFKKNNLLFPA